MKKASDEQLLAAYAETSSVWKTAERFGMCGQSVHERLTRLGAVKPTRVFTDAERERLRGEYVAYRDAGRLQDLADDMGRTKQFICRQAGKLGLTDKSHGTPWVFRWEDVDDAVIKDIIDKMTRSRSSMSAYMKKHGYGVSFSEEASRRFPAEWEALAELKRSGKMYRRGRDFEYATKRDMEKKGYVVMRSPASKSPADLMAVRGGVPVLVQCKLHGELPPGEWNEFMDYAEKAGAAPVMSCRGAGDRGVSYYLLTERKDGSRRRQPMRLVDIESWEEK